jgi:hypothetical protein
MENQLRELLILKLGWATLTGTSSGCSYIERWLVLEFRGLLQLADPTFFPVPYRCMALASAHKSPERTQQEVKASQINSPFFPSPSSITSSTPQPPLHQMRQYPQPLFQHTSPLMIPFPGLIVRDDPTSVGEYIGEYIAKRCVRQHKRTSLYRLAFEKTSFDPCKLP